MPRHYRRSSGISEFPSDSGLLLFDPLFNRLLAFNQAARLLWESIDVGVSLDGIAADFVAKYGISLATARRDIDAMIENWQALGLLGGDDRPVPVQAQDCTDWPQAPPSAWRDTAIYTVRDKTFSLASEMPDSLAMMRRFFRHLETPDAEPGLRLEVRQTADGSPALLLNGREQFRTGDEAQLIGGISQAVLEYLHPGVEWLAMMHGGAVTRNGRGLAFPATSGSGKTTLIASLIAREGFTYLADDLIVLSAPSGHIVPWPMPLNIKEGSWTLLSRSHPGLNDAPVHDSFRGAARLLVAPSSSWYADPAPVQAIVFPQYAAGAAVKLTRIPAFEAIARLLNDRIWLGYPMTDHRIRAFLAWINATPAYSLVHGNVADAARCLEDLP
ncbi:PqqD family protein [Bradyrhizobium sp.]|uniref:PqqD family protein n=1 Tax=Bradyrhizobium sp. TaxID=376 RepID=UPI0027332B4E|nr:PqqD family protein [Bradyrhizobium sp.]MDP3690332.1 PqqD family protein [Bradyrhizobium sp.]